MAQERGIGGLAPRPALGSKDPDVAEGREDRRGSIGDGFAHRGIPAIGQNQDVIVVSAVTRFA